MLSTTAESEIEHDEKARWRALAGWFVVATILCVVLIALLFRSSEDNGVGLGLSSEGDQAAIVPDTTPPTFLTDGPPWGDGDQFEWEARTGLRPVPVGSTWGFMRAEDQNRISGKDPFGQAPVYILQVDGTLGTQIGVWTGGGVFDMSTATQRSFDVRGIMLADQGADYVYYLEHKNELSCEETVELLDLAATTC